MDKVVELFKQTVGAGKRGKVLKVVVQVEAIEDMRLDLGADESYRIKIGEDMVGDGVVGVDVFAKTFFGARHALETLSQLIRKCRRTGNLFIHSRIDIEDEPKFPYRGLMLDVSRHFISKHKIKKIIRAMGYQKLNSLHIHFSDTSSFPLEIPNQPNMTEFGAFSSSEVYSVDDVKEIVEYALVNGVRVIPEIDIPAHANQGWQWGSDAGLGDLVVCTNPDNWDMHSLEPPCGQFNVINPNLSKIFGEIYSHLVTEFGAVSNLIHMGGDEILVGSDETNGCWNQTENAPQILEYLELNGLDRGDPETFYKLWIDFTKSSLQKVENAFSNSYPTLNDIRMIQWGGNDEPSDISYNLLTRPDIQSILDPKKVIIQLWDGSKESYLPHLLEKGYDIILSHTDYMYLDCGASGWSAPGGYWCQPYTEWFSMYDYIRDIRTRYNIDKYPSQIKGAEATAWAELMDDTNIEQKIWPRVSALAEALWSDPDSDDWRSANGRIHNWRNLLVKRGILAEPLQPQWCDSQPSSYCTMPSNRKA
jgi:hexosaminidase